ncbi:lipopolysaccharide biosynthesis protein [Curtobacterium sp. 9128]|uniref:lipopolysaccharide biosynthesis protein n=1 Tax=Curtobacterium sp. 9128 TaxID=1793722 RepID=UPI00164269DD|nr:oligosaccharide flippase family protein [Curtobacterium sp. 9128]
MRRARARSAVLTILCGTVLGQGLVIAVSPLLTRLYAPTDFGLLAVVTAIASVLGAGGASGADRAVAVARNGSIPALVLIGAVSTLLVGLAAAAAAWTMRDLLAAGFAAPAFADLWWIVPVTTVAVALQRMATAVLARRQHHRSIAVRNVCQGVGQTLWNLGMASTGALGLAGGLAAGRLAAVLGTLRPRRQRTWERRAPVTAVLHVHRRFLWITPWSSMLNVVGQQAPGILIAAAQGSATAGLVALTMRVLGSPVGMLADAVAQTVAGSFGRRVREGEPIRAPLRRLVARLLVLGCAGAVGVVLCGPAVFGAVFGSEWSTAGEYARILVPAFALQVAVSPVSQVLGMLGRQHVQLAWDAGRLVLTVGAVLVPTMCGAPVPVVLAGLSSAMIVSYLVMLALVAGAVRGDRG